MLGDFTIGQLHAIHGDSITEKDAGHSRNQSTVKPADSMRADYPSDFLLKSKADAFRLCLNYVFDVFDWPNNYPRKTRGDTADKKLSPPMLVPVRVTAQAVDDAQRHCQHTRGSQVQSREALVNSPILPSLASLSLDLRIFDRTFDD